VPDAVYEVPEVPRTLSGKVTEVPVKRILEGGDPEQVVSKGSLANPGALEVFVELGERFAAGDPE
jgi:acetoacetyl-CoA synthetase